MQVSEIMTKRPVYADSKDSLFDAVKKLYELDIRHLPVLEDGQLVGILSDRDLRAYAIPLTESHEVAFKMEKLLSTKVADVMQTDVISVEAAADLLEVIDIMVEHKVGAVPVLDSHAGRLIGIVSYIDVLEAARNAFDPE